MGFMDKFKPKPVKLAKIIGVRTAEQSKALSDVNFGVYSFLVECTDGTVEVREAAYRSDAFNELMQYVIFPE